MLRYCVGVSLLWFVVACAASGGTGGATGATGATGASGGGGHALVLVGEPRVVADPNLFHVDGRVKNTGTRPYSAGVKVTLFDANGKIVGVFSGAVNDVAPGEEATYTAIGTDKPTAWAKVDARIEGELPG